MSLFIQSLVALAASVSAAPATAPDAAPEPAAIVAEAQGDIEFAPNLLAKLDSVTPRSEVNRGPIWGQTWPQTLWAQIQPKAVDAPDDAPQMSASEAFRQIDD